MNGPIELTRANGWRYLGDGVYYNIKPYEVKLVTYDGIKIGNQIVLEPSHVETLIHAILEYKLARLQKSMKESEEE